MSPGNKYYEPGEKRAAKVGDLFASIARRYDFLNDLQSFGQHRRWKRLLVEMAEIKPGDHALDLCCGTGDLSFALRDAGADVTGLDFSPAMLQVAKKRLVGDASGRLKFIQGDAMAIPFDNASFDVVTVGYGLRNLASWEHGLKEMARVAKPGGRLLVLEFGKPPNKLWRAVYYFSLRTFVPLLGKLFCKDAAAYAYIYESLQHYPAQQGVADKMKLLGCENVQVRQLMGGAMSIHLGRVPANS